RHPHHGARCRQASVARRRRRLDGLVSAGRGLPAQGQRGRSPARHGAQALLLGQRQGHPRRPGLCQARPDQVCTRLARLANRRGYHYLQNPNLSRAPGLPKTEGSLMPAKSLASPPATLASRKGVALLAPAILLLGATLAVGQSTPPPAQVAQAAAPAP